MSQSLSGPPSIATFAHPDANAVEYLVDNRTNRITVRIDGQTADLAFTGTDGGAIGLESWPIVADVAFSFTMDGGSGRVSGLRFYVATAAATTARVFSEPV